MGQKISPKSFRLGILYQSNARWFAKRENFAKQLREDVLLRQELLKDLKDASVDKVDIERAGKDVTIYIHSAKPGFIIGRAGAGAENLKNKLQNKFFKGKKTLNINIIEVSKANLSARIVAEDMARDIEKRMPVRRVMKQGLEKIKKAGALGGKVKVGGRLNGAEIARKESILWGKVPLHNLRADIDFASSVASTIYGSIGVKIWIYKGDVFK